MTPELIRDSPEQIHMWGLIFLLWMPIVFGLALWVLKGSKEDRR